MESTKKAHSIGGIVLVILAILAALFLSITFGAIGGGLAAFLALIALILGLNAKRKGGKGLGVVVMSVLAIALAAALTFGSASFIKDLHRRAAATGQMPLLEKYSDSPYLGLIGIAYRAGQDGADMEQLVKEMELANKLVNDAAGTESTADTE